MILYPCGVMFMGQRLEPPRTDGNPRGWEIHPSGRSLSRLVRARFRASLTFTFRETWKVETICCLGPCVLVEATLGSQIVYPYPQHSGDDGTLYVIADRILEADHVMRIEVECRPQLFMLERDDADEGQRSGFADETEGMHVHP